LNRNSNLVAARSPERSEATGAIFPAAIKERVVMDNGGRLKFLSATLLMQFQADVLNVPVIRPVVSETTCLGAAYAAGLAVGYWPNIEGLRANWNKSVEWQPRMSAAERGKGFRKWKKAVARTMDWMDADEET
jgi:glycerol kinase